jgi:hypothetical protein
MPSRSRPSPRLARPQPAAGLILCLLLTTQATPAAECGTTWTPQASGTAGTLFSVARGGGRFVAVGDNGTILTSPNGKRWQRASTTPSGAALFGVAHGPKSLVAVGAAETTPPGCVHSSILPGLSFPLCTQYNDFPTYSGNATLTSPDGRRWTRVDVNSSDAAYGIAWGHGRFAAVGAASALTSRNGRSWNAASLEAARAADFAYFTGVAWGHGQFVAVGFGGAVQTSPDGSAWTPQASGTSSTLNRVAWAHDRFVAAGENGALLTSPDGVAWTPQASGTSDTLNAATWHHGQFVVVGDNGTILTSRDGASWVAAASGTSSALRGVAWGRGRLVAVGDGGTVLSSACP